MTSQVRELELLRNRGVQVEGKISSVNDQIGKYNEKHLYYSFDTPQGPIQAEFDKSRAGLYDVAEGSPVMVTYLPEDPNRHRIGTIGHTEIGNLTVSWQIVLWMLTGIASLGYWILVGSYSSQRTLLMNGICVKATTTSVKVHIGKSSYREVSYRYTSLNGKECSGYVSANLGADWAQETGTELPYLYLPGEVWEGKLLPQFKLVELGPEPA
jgi:hypothetical protein